MLSSTWPTFNIDDNFNNFIHLTTRRVFRFWPSISKNAKGLVLEIAPDFSFHDKTAYK